MGAGIWTKVTAVLETEPEDWSVWAELFERHGLGGTVQTDEPPTISAYLPPGSESEFEPLKVALLAFGAADVKKELVPEEDWAESWKQFFVPTQIGPFLVRPTWEGYELRPDDIEIVLDPGQAFGTGDHPTTRMCLILLAKALSEGATGLECADIGCGSGILSIGALKLGVKTVVAVDSDPVSIESTLENCHRNEVHLEAVVGRGFDSLADEETFDLVLSNIISAALISLAPEASRRVRPGGKWIVSGIIEANWNDVQAAAERCGFSLLQKMGEGEWVAATFIR